MNHETRDNCPTCEHRNETMRRRRLIRHRARKAYFEAKRDAILSGKVIVMTCRDELTGFFYRYDKNSGNLVTLGKGDNCGA